MKCNPKSQKFIKLQRRDKFVKTMITILFCRLCRADRRGRWQLPPRSTSCLLYLNGPAAALGVIAASAISGVTATSGESEGVKCREDYNTSCNASSLRLTPIVYFSHESWCGWVVLCWAEHLWQTVSNYSLQEGKQVL